MTKKPTYKELEKRIQESDKAESERKLIEKDLHESEEKYRHLFENMMSGFALHEIICDDEGHPIDYRFLDVNTAFERLTGLKSDALLRKTVKEVMPDTETYWIEKYGQVAKTGESIEFENYSKELDRHYHVMAYRPAPNQFACIFQDITDNKNSEIKLKNALALFEVREKEVSALLKGARAVLENDNFQIIARKVFDISCEIIGAQSGYVALLSDDGAENEVLFLEAGQLPCDVDPDLPMPIRGLRAEAYKFNKVVYHNDFMNSEWVDFMPKGHVILKNVMFAPLVLKEKTVGIIGLANKAEDFNDNDARLAAGFGEQAAIALQNSKNLDERIRAEKKRERVIEKLKENEERLKSISSSVNDALMTIDDNGSITFWNDAAEKIFGYNKNEVMGKDLHRLLTPEKYLDAYKVGFDVFRKTGTGSAIGKTLEMSAVRKDGNEFPIELSLASYFMGGKWHAVGTIRDITERKKIEEEREKLISDLQKAIQEVKKLSGLLPICSYCKKIRNDEGYWDQIESYIHDHSEADFSHGICPECAKKYYPDMDLYGD